MVRLFPELLDGPVQVTGSGFHRPARACSPLEQIGSTHVAHENKISGQGAHRFRAALDIDDEKYQMLRRVTGRV